MRYLFGSILVIAFASAVASENAVVDDNVVKSRLVMANRCRHAEVQDGYRRHAFEMIGYDTNRFCRVLKELTSEDPKNSSVYIWMVGECGGTNELEYIYGVLSSTNATFESKGAAAEVAMRFDVPGQRLLTALQDYIVDSNNVERARRNFVARRAAHMFRASNNTCLESSMRETLLRFAREDYSYCITMDDLLCETVSNYECSVQRLGYLRGALNSGSYTGKDYPYGIITNRIEWLVAYPESNLTDIEETVPQ